MPYTVQQIQEQNQVFQTALRSGRITQAQYDHAMETQNQNMQQATISQPTTQVPVTYNETETPWGTTTQPIHNPSAPLSPVQQTVPVPTEVAQNIASVNIPENPENVVPGSIAYNPTEQNITYQSPPPTTPSALEQAKQSAQIDVNYGNQAQTRGGTSAPVSIESVMAKQNQITSGLSPEEKTAFIEWQHQQAPEAMKKIGLTMTAAAVAPVLGPVGAVEAAGLGIGVSQGIKTGSTVLQGGKIEQSLLTPNEAIEAAETGIIFSGASKAALSIAGRYGGQFGRVVAHEPEAIKSASIPTQIAASGARLGINTGIGAGGGALLSEDRVQGAIQGAEFGFAFGAIGEVASTAPSIKSGIQSKVIDANVNRLSNIAEKHEVAFNNNQLFKPTLTERITMKTTGVRPINPQAEYVGLKDLPSAGVRNAKTGITEGFQTETKLVNQQLPPHLQKVIDVAVEKYGVPAPRVELYDNIMRGPDITDDVIRLSAKETPSQQEVSLAHELGHYIDKVSEQHGSSSKLYKQTNQAIPSEPSETYLTRQDKFTEFIEPKVRETKPQWATEWDVNKVTSKHVLEKLGEYDREQYAWDIGKTLLQSDQAKKEYLASSKESLRTYEPGNNMKYTDSQIVENALAGEPKLLASNRELKTFIKEKPSTIPKPKGDIAESFNRSPAIDTELSFSKQGKNFGEEILPGENITTEILNKKGSPKLGGYKDIVDANLKKATEVQSDMINSNSVIYGRTIDRTEYFQKAEPRKTSKGALSFDKTKYMTGDITLAEYQKGQALAGRSIIGPTTGNFSPTEMATNKLLYNTKTKGQIEPSAFEDVHNALQHTKPWSGKETSQLKEAKEFTVSELDIANSFDFESKPESIKEMAKRVGISESTAKALRGNPITESKIKYDQDPIIQELTGGRTSGQELLTEKKTGFDANIQYNERYIQQKTSGSPLDLGRTQKPTRGYDPTVYSGPSYYPQKQAREEEEIIYISTPNSGLPKPEQPKTFSLTKQATSSMVGFSNSNNLFNSQISLGTKDTTKPIDKQPTMIESFPIQNQKSRQTVGTMPDQVQIITPIINPITQPVTRTNKNNNYEPKNNNTFPQAPFMLPGSKAMEFGGSSFSNPFFTGIGSRKREYPIASAEEFWG